MHQVRYNLSMYFVKHRCQDAQRVSMTMFNLTTNQSLHDTSRFRALAAPKHDLLKCLAGMYLPGVHFIAQDVVIESEACCKREYRLHSYALSKPKTGSHAMTTASLILAFYERTFVATCDQQDIR